MKALITGASTGIGRDMARILHREGHELYLVARNGSLLKDLCCELDNKPKLFSMDLSVPDNCFELYDKLKNENIDILINNAGFGAFGYSSDVELDRELSMIDLNIKAVHILTKLFLEGFEQRDFGYVLNVASSAAFLPGPLMSAYYATKAYVLRLSTALNEELRRKKSKVYVGVLCPGPVDTEFNRTAGVSFNLKSITSRRVAEYAIKSMFDRKSVIIPEMLIKLGVFAQRLAPTRLLLKITYNIQKSKG